MNRVVAALSLTAAFAAGCGVTHLIRPALAAENLTAQVIHTGELEGDTISPVNSGGMRNKVLGVADGMTIAPAVQGEPLPGNPPKQILLQMAVADPQVPNLAIYQTAKAGIGLVISYLLFQLFVFGIFH